MTEPFNLIDLTDLKVATQADDPDRLRMQFALKGGDCDGINKIDPWKHINNFEEEFKI